MHMEYGALTLLPILFIIVMAVLTRKSFESLLAGSVIACIIMHGTGFFLPWTDTLLEALSDPENQWVILVCGLFGSLIALLRESKGTGGFARLGERLCRNERSALLGTFVLGIVIFVDDYLNMLTVGTCMREVCDRRKIPRESLAYVLDSTGTPVCVLLPFSTWSAFYISLFMKEEAVQALGFSSGLEMYIRTIPFIFYAIVTLLIVFLFSMGWVPKLGLMKKAYARVRETGRTYSEESARLNLEPEDAGAEGKILDFLLPVALLIAATILIGDILPAVILALALCLVLYVPRGKMSFSQWSGLLISGFCEMMPTLAILAGAFTVARCCNAMRLPEYVIAAVQPFVTPQTYPLIIFLVVSVLTFSTSSTWGISTIVVPIIIPLGAAVGANIILTMAAILSGSTFGSHACFYSDATVLASVGARIENTEHAFSQMPYAVIGAAVTCVCLLAAGYVLPA
ncbi:MAG: Na+/H+ antiporter NhaC family protein [Eubacteriales bacterium]|nr:Na+/H+ antiporter NhaC family protein [Eubacteriales bacterium]